MPTNPIQAYKEGKQAKLDNPDAKYWSDVLPYSVTPLTWAWLDGWKGVEYDLEKICHYCWSHSMTDLPDGTLRCKQCWDKNYPKVDKTKVDCHLAKRDAGSFI